MIDFVKLYWIRQIGTFLSGESSAFMVNGLKSPLEGEEHETSKYWFKLSEMVRLPRGVPPERIVGNRPLMRGWIIDEEKITFYDD